MMIFCVITSLLQDALASILPCAGQTYQSEVAGGRIARFTLTRLCCSQVRLIPNLFQTPFRE